MRPLIGARIVVLSRLNFAVATVARGASAAAVQAFTQICGRLDAEEVTRRSRRFGDTRTPAALAS